MNNKSLIKFAYLSITAAILTISLKFIAYSQVRSVGLLSDALESIINLVAAVVALIVLYVSEKPADKEHEYGHTKAEYFSSAIEGGLVLLAAGSIIRTAVPKLFNPRELQDINIGIIITVIASLINFIVAKILIHNGEKENSLLLKADGKHLIADVWTSAGVVIGIIIVKIFGILILDPIIAILIALNILRTGYKLLKESANGLMDVSIPQSDVKKIEDYLKKLEEQGVEYHSLLTREAGRQKFISLHLLMPGKWTVQKGHDIADKVEKDIENIFEEPTSVISHIEPIEDPASFHDIGIYRTYENENKEEEKNQS